MENACVTCVAVLAGRVDLQYCKLVDVPLDVLSYDAVPPPIVCGALCYA